MGVGAAAAGCARAPRRPTASGRRRWLILSAGAQDLPLTDISDCADFGPAKKGAPYSAYARALEFSEENADVTCTIDLAYAWWGGDWVFTRRLRAFHLRVRHVGSGLAAGHAAVHEGRHRRRCRTRQQRGRLCRQVDLQAAHGQA